MNKLSVRTIVEIEVTNNPKLRGESVDEDNTEIVVGSVYLFPNNDCYTTDFVASCILRKKYRMVELKPSIETIRQLGWEYTTHHGNMRVHGYTKLYCLEKETQKLTEEMVNLVNTNSKSFVASAVNGMISNMESIFE